MSRPLLRIPYTNLPPAHTIIPHSATTVAKAVEALEVFFTTPSSPSLSRPSASSRASLEESSHHTKHRAAATVVLTGAGLSVASGLPDYRGDRGTYRVNKTYRHIYYNEFLTSHATRSRYWARSFLGWPTLLKSAPNAGHYAIARLGQLGLVRSVITQNVDSFHLAAHPQLPTLELHGRLRSAICTSCRHQVSRGSFQQELARLNPLWASLLEEISAGPSVGALDTTDAAQLHARGMTVNADGDVDLPGAPYSTFRYPPCPRCLEDPMPLKDGSLATVHIDEDGAWEPTSSSGVLKPDVVMFGENILSDVKDAGEEAIDGADRILIVGTSLATFSAWRLVKRALDRGMPIALVNIGGVRGEDLLFASEDPRKENGSHAVRVNLPADKLLPALVDRLEALSTSINYTEASHAIPSQSLGGHSAFKDMLS